MRANTKCNRRGAEEDERDAEEKNGRQNDEERQRWIFCPLGVFLGRVHDVLGRTVARGFQPVSCRYSGTQSRQRNNFQQVSLARLRASTHGTGWKPRDTRAT